MRDRKEIEADLRENMLDGRLKRIEIEVALDSRELLKKLVEQGKPLEMGGSYSS